VPVSAAASFAIVTAEPAAATLRAPLKPVVKKKVVKKPVVKKKVVAKKK
jgi:hypothetical protein